MKMFQRARKSIAATQFINPRLLIPISFFAFAVAATMASGQTREDQVVDLSHVPQIHETPEQRDARMQWFRDAKFGMFIHWGPCTVGDREIGWGRNANRPWDINGSTARAPAIRTTTITSSDSTR